MLPNSTTSKYSKQYESSVAEQERIILHKGLKSVKSAVHKNKRGLVTYSSDNGTESVSLALWLFPPAFRGKPAFRGYAANLEACTKKKSPGFTAIEGEVAFNAGIGASLPWSVAPAVWVFKKELDAKKAAQAESGKRGYKISEVSVHSLSSNGKMDDIANAALKYAKDRVESGGRNCQSIGNLRRFKDSVKVAKLVSRASLVVHKTIVYPGE